MSKSTRLVSEFWSVTGQKNLKEAMSRNISMPPPCNTKPDLICGGFPCQDLSVAGKRKGLAGERSGLWFAFRDIIAELKPRWVVIENVPGLLSSHEGRDFALLLYGLAELDYGLASRVLDSQYLGVPQRRRRVFIVGSLGCGSSIEVLFEPESVRGDSAPSRAQGQRIAGTAAARPGRNGDRFAGEGGIVSVASTLGGGSGKRGFCDDLDRSGAFIPEVSKTLTSEGADGSSDGSSQGAPIIAGCLSPGTHPGGFNGQDAYNDHLVVTGGETKWSKGTGGPAGDECQNLVAVSEMERWRQTCGCGHSFVGRLDERCPSCGKIREGFTHGDPIEPIPIQEFAKRHSGASMNGVGHGASGDPMFTLQASAEHAIAFHGAQDPSVSGNITHPVGRNGGLETCIAFSGKDSGADASGEVAPTLRAMPHDKSHMNGGGQMVVAFQESQTGCREYPDAGTLRANGPGHDPVGTRLRTKMGVRRLTPRECERLQGFPDDWTRWDSAGKEISDSARYRTIGNAVTVNVAEWIGRQLMRAEGGSK